MANVSGHSAADDSGVEEDAQASQGAEELNSDAPNADMQTELERLRRVVAQWNASRLDLFEISEPNEVREHYSEYWNVRGGWLLASGIQEYLQICFRPSFTFNAVFQVCRFWERKVN